ncbi:MAG: tetratricopeptide repeat protein [Caulobacteraceae bacterium]
MTPSADPAQLGLSLRKLGRPAEAEPHLRAVVQQAPNDPDAHNNLGAVLSDLGRLEEAQAAYIAAVTLKPDHAEAYHNLGGVLRVQGQLDAAEACYRNALILRPDQPQTHNNLGVCLVGMGRLPEAEACFRASLDLAPDQAEALNNLGSVHRQLGRFAQAEPIFRQALAIRPRYPDAQNNLGNTLISLGDFTGAQAQFRAVIAARPDHAEAHANLALTLLAAGELDEGWREYEWRWKAKGLKARPHVTAAPLWTGEPLAGRTLLLHAEQGLGDTLQFCRYAPLITGGRVVMEVQAPLVELMTTLGGGIEVIARGDPAPAFDVQCPLVSLPRAFGTRLETIPARIPYLSVDPVRRAIWRARLAPLEGLKVGLVWAGGARPDQPATNAVNARRSMTLAAMAPLGGVAGVSFVSLQKGQPAEAEALSPPEGLALLEFADDLHDFADTAALTATLDLVISVDTAVVHLAGALGKPVWMLNRYDTCWRWLLGREDSPWYPSLRQFRQAEAGNWAAVVDDVAAALRREVELRESTGG